MNLLRSNFIFVSHFQFLFIIIPYKLPVLHDSEKVMEECIASFYFLTLYPLLPIFIIIFPPLLLWTEEIGLAFRFAVEERQAQYINERAYFSILLSLYLFVNIFSSIHNLLQ